MPKMIDCPKCSGTGKIKDNASVAEEVKRFREKHSLTLTEVAKEMGLTKAYISDLEHARRTWSDALEKRYCDAVLKLIVQKGVTNV
jgi:predicted transcriptional regulator